jgi:CRISPR-associated protein Cas1
VSHHNRGNAFCLADDLMEPLRPLVDRNVALLCRDLPSGQWEVNKAFKQWILAYLTGRFRAAGECRTLFDAMARRAARLAAVFTRQEKDFVWEDIEPAS